MVGSFLVAAMIAAASTTPTPTPTGPSIPSFPSFPQGKVRKSERGHIAIATNLSVPAMDADPEISAKKFIRAHGAALGVSASDALETMQKVKPGTGGTVIFRRTVQGLPVLEAHVSVAIAANGTIHAVTSGGALPKTVVPFLIDEAAAKAKALERLQGEVLSVERAFIIRSKGTESHLQPVILVGVVAQNPYRSHRFVVDGVTGSIGFAPSMLQHAPTGKVYRISPAKPYATKTPAEACALEDAMSGQTPVKRYALCAKAEDVELLGLKGDGTLTGAPMKGVGRTTIYNCQGGTTYDTTACTQTMRADNSGNFVPASLTEYGANKTDPMSELMAYYQVDRHSRFMDSLDTNFAGLPLIPGFTNAYGAPLINLPIPGFNDPAPLDNAFYDPQKKQMVFGQGSSVDFAYDGEVIYHEMTHAACDAIGTAAQKPFSLMPFPNSRGLYMESFGINEGNADSFALMEPGVDDPHLGEFDARDEIGALGQTIPVGPNGYVRNMSAEPMRTCQGNGTAGNPGVDSEPHDDGEIWGQYIYELHNALKRLPDSPRGTSPLAPPLFKALQSLISAPREQQSFAAFADLTESNVRAMYGDKAGNYAQCLAEKRAMESCGEQVVSVYSGEGPFNDQYVKDAWKSFYLSPKDVYGAATIGPEVQGIPAGHQWKLTVPAGATALKVNVCDITPSLKLGPLVVAEGKGRLFIRKGKPVEYTITGSGETEDFNWQAGVKASWAFDYVDCNAKGPEVTLTTTGCTGCGARTEDSKETLSEGDWYFLVANTGAQASFASFKATLTGANVPTRPGSGMTKQCEIPWPPRTDVETGTDAGTPGVDAGMNGPGSEVDAGNGSAGTPDGGECADPTCTNMLPPKGCGCGAGGLQGMALGGAIFLLALARRSRRSEQ